MNRTRRRPRVAALVVLGGLVLAGCSTSSDEPAAEPSTAESSTAESSAEPSATAVPEGPTYVALGDSYTSAPLISEQATEDGCLRSSTNYPALVAEELGAELTDVSCGGAETTHVTAPQPTLTGTVPPQLDAVGADTELVTIGLGGNDRGVFSRLIGCTQQRAADPEGSPCLDALGPEGVATLEQDVAATGPALTAVIEQVRERAPDAEIVVVGYPRFVPDEGACPDLMPLATGDVPFLADLNEQLADVQAEAARAAGATYVDVYAASAGHDVCSAQPWVNGQQTVPGTALAFHPLAAGQQAVADLVLEAVAG